MVLVVQGSCPVLNYDKAYFIKRPGTWTSTKALRLVTGLCLVDFV